MTDKERLIKAILKLDESICSDLVAYSILLHPNGELDEEYKNVLVQLGCECFHVVMEETSNDN